MTVLETALVFVGIPLGVAGIIVALVYGASARRFPRYRPGRPFDVMPVWFLSTPPTADTGSSRPALTAGPPDDGRAATPHGGPKGGARGSW